MGSKIIDELLSSSVPEPMRNITKAAIQAALNNMSSQYCPLYFSAFTLETPAKPVCWHVKMMLHSDR